ncbi:MAG: aspartyl protease family protein [Bacteroidota bacterium]
MTHSVPFRIIQIPHQGFHIMCVMEMSGYKLNVLIDTGASLTVFDVNRFKNIYPQQEVSPYENSFRGITSHAIPTWSATVEVLDIGSLQLTDLRILLVDLASINQTYAHYDLPRIDAVLGGDLLLALKTRIDYASRTLILETTT